MEQGWISAKGPLNEEDKRRLILRLVTRLKCAQCGQLYDPKDFTLLHRWQDLWVLGTHCRHCDQPCHVVVFMRLDVEPQPLTDLTPEELKSGELGPPITADDVLDMHELLREFDGNLETLFAG